RRSFPQSALIETSPNGPTSLQISLPNRAFARRSPIQARRASEGSGTRGASLAGASGLWVVPLPLRPGVLGRRCFGGRQEEDRFDQLAIGVGEAFGEGRLDREGDGDAAAVGMMDQVVAPLDRQPFDHTFRSDV